MYFMHEQKRLTLVEKSIGAKVEELARRADDKSRTVAEITKRMTLNDRQQVDPTVQATMRGSLDDARSEFSVDTQESTLDSSENVLDFKIEEAEFDVEAVAAMPSLGMTLDEI